MKRTLLRIVVAVCLTVGYMAPSQILAATTLSLTAGWNLVSSSTPVTDAATTFGDPAKFTSVWSWDSSAANGGKWKVLLADGSVATAAYAQDKGFTPLTAINAADGFWINSTASQSLTIPGTAATDATITLVDGWNLKGVNTTIDAAAVFSAKALAETYKYASVWKWNGALWSVFIPGETSPGAYANSKGFGQLTTLSPNEGFWVNVNPSQGGNVVVTPPFLAGTVNYPTTSTLAKIGALGKAGLFAASATVEMPPTPGATVSIYTVSDTNQTTPLATTTTDEGGVYLFTDEDFDNPGTTEVEPPPQVPVVVAAEFKSPIDQLNKVKVTALIDPNDGGQAGSATVNPLTTAIGDKIMAFVKDTFQVDVTTEIMTAAKSFIDLIAIQVEAQGLTYFKEADLVVGQYTAPDSEEEDPNFIPPPSQNVADTVLDATTSGLFTSMENDLLDKAKDFTQTQVTIDGSATLAALEKFLATLGFAVETTDHKQIIFIPSPPDIPENSLPGATLFNDQSFRLITAADLVPEKLAILNNPGFLNALKRTITETPPLSHQAVLAIQDAIDAGSITTLTQIASVIKDQFQWQTETMQMVSGMPVFSGVSQAPATGASVNATELIAAVSGKIADTPYEVAKDIANQPYNIMRLADQAINQKINLILGEPAIEEKSKAVADFLQNISTFEDLKELVQESDIFKHEVQSISSRIYAALTPDLYGQALSASTGLKIKSALMITRLITDRDYLINDDAGWFTMKTAGDKSWIEPNFGNRKWLMPANDGPGVVSSIVSQLLGTAINDGPEFAFLVDAIHQAATNITGGQEFIVDKTTISQIIAADQVSQTTVNGQISNYDGTTWANKTIAIKTYDQNGALIDAAPSVPTDADGFFSVILPTGKAYELHFAGINFIYPFFADTFTGNLDLMGIWLPPSNSMGGAKGFPGISLWLGQKFFNFNDPQDPNNGKPEGIDFSNFNAAKPFIVFDGGDGVRDLSWVEGHGLWAQGAAQIASLGTGDTLQHGLGSDALLNHSFTADELNGTAPIILNNQTITLVWNEDWLLPEDDNAIYVIKDNGGQYFFIEVRDYDQDEQGMPNGIIDMGFAKLGSNGMVELPSETFIDGPPGGATPGGMVDMSAIELNPGDVFDLEANGWSAPETEPFGYDATATANSDIAWLASFYDTYWKNTTDGDQRKAALANSNRALSVLNGATLSTVTHNPMAMPPITVTEVASGVVTNIIPGAIFQVTTQDNTSFILMVKSVAPDTIELAVIPKGQMLDGGGNLMPGIGDQDQDGIPSVFDDNDLAKDEFDAEDFEVIDDDNDGTPAQFDPNDDDATIPNSSGQPFL